MADIIDVATREFAEKGLEGARVDLIAEAMRTSKRMIYYYFISALSFFNVANRHTFSLIFGSDTATPAGAAARRESIVAMVMRHVKPGLADAEALLN